LNTSASRLVDRLLAVAFRHRIVAPDAEGGVARLAELAGQTEPLSAWHAAVAEAVRQGFLHEPVRLLPDALQCHWRLELTSAGVSKAATQR
jgi:hypothetical protein